MFSVLLVEMGFNSVMMVRPVDPTHGVVLPLLEETRDSIMYNKWYCINSVFSYLFDHNASLPPHTFKTVQLNLN